MDWVLLYGVGVLTGLALGALRRRRDGQAMMIPRWTTKHEGGPRLPGEGKWKR